MDLVKGYNSEMESDSDIEEVPLPPKHVEIIDIDNSDSDVEVERGLVPVSNQSVSIFIKSEPGLNEQDSALKSGHPTKEPGPTILDSASNKSRLATKEPESVLTERNTTLTTTSHTTKQSEPIIVERDTALTNKGYTTKQPEPVIEQVTALTKTGNTTKQPEPVTERNTALTKTGHITKQPNILIKTGPVIIEQDTALTKIGHTTKQSEPIIVEQDAALTNKGYTTKQREPVIEQDTALTKTGNTTKQPEPVTEQNTALTKTGHITKQPNILIKTGPVIIEQDTVLTKTGQITNQPTSLTETRHITNESTDLTKTGKTTNQATTLTNVGDTIKEPVPTTNEQNTTLTNTRHTNKELEPDIIELLESALNKPDNVMKKPESAIINLESTPTKSGNATKEPEPDIIDLESTPTKPSNATTEPEPAIIDLESTPSKPGTAINESESLLMKQGHVTKEPDSVFMKQAFVTKEPESVFMKQGHVTKEPESVFMKQGHVTKEPESVFMKQGHVTKEPESVFMKQGHVTKESDPVLTIPSQPTKEPQPELSSIPVPEDDDKENDEMNVSSSPVKSHDERSAVTGNDNLVCRIPRHMIEIKNAHKDLVSSIDWCTVNNPSVFLSSSCDGFIKLWDVINMNLKHFLRVPTQVTASKWSLDGAIIFTGGSNKKLAIYEAQTVTKFIEYDVYCKVYSMAIHPYIHDVVMVGLKNVMLGYDLRVDSLLPIRTFPCKCEEVLDIAFLDDNVFVSSGNIGFNDSNRNRITAWEFGSSKALSTEVFSDHCVCPSLKLHPSDSTFIAQTTSNYIATFSSVYPFTMKNKKFAGHNVNSQLIECDISPDGKYVATGDANGAVHFYSYAGGNQVYTSSPQSAGINRIKWNPHITTTMITSSVNGNIQIWN